jgi:hypothetical protein
MATSLGHQASFPSQQACEQAASLTPLESVSPHSRRLKAVGRVPIPVSLLEPVSAYRSSTSRY